MTIPGAVRGAAYAIVLTAAVLPGGPATAGDRQPTERIDVTASRIDAFKIDTAETRFGPLEFVGGLEMSSASADFGAFSSFRFLSPGGQLIGITDTGFWFRGTIERDGQGRPSGVADFRMTRMADRAGTSMRTKRNVDAEGLGVHDNLAVVGFERQHRVVEFKLEPGDRAIELKSLDFLVPARELRNNRGFETVAFSPVDGPAKGALVVVSEKSLDRQGNIFAAVLSGPKKGVFTVKRDDSFDITDGAFLPNGDLLLLERAFSMARGVSFRLRRIAGDAIVGGTQAANGPVLLQANMAYQIDNMEGMDVWHRADGATMVSLMSDDNNSMLQRNLYLEFRLHED